MVGARWQAHLLPLLHSSLQARYLEGSASYWQLVDDPGGMPVAWSYSNPFPAFEKIRDYLCFYPARIACYVDGERVQAQTGEFYGGWITEAIVGPFKGDPGSGHW